MAHTFVTTQNALLRSVFLRGAGSFAGLGRHSRPKAIALRDNICRRSNCSGNSLGFARSSPYTNVAWSRSDSAPEPQSQDEAKIEKSNQDPPQESGKETPNESAKESSHESGKEPANESGLHTPDEPGKEPPHKTEKDRILQLNDFRMGSLPIRHAVREMQLRFVNYFFPLAWNWKEFSEGVPFAIQSVHEMVVAGDFSNLDDLMEQALLEELKAGGQEMLDREGWAEPPELISAVPQGIFTALAHGDEEGITLRVEPLVEMTERYKHRRVRVPGESEILVVKRYQTWGFQQRFGANRSETGFALHRMYASEPCARACYGDLSPDRNRAISEIVAGCNQPARF